jgi:hypothetical protein
LNTIKRREKVQDDRSERRFSGKVRAVWRLKSAEPARSADRNRQNNAPGQPESAQKQLTAKFDLVCETNLKEKSGVIGARVRGQTGKANFWRRIGDLPGVYFAEFLGFATLRPKRQYTGDWAGAVRFRRSVSEIPTYRQEHQLRLPLFA